MSDVLSELLEILKLERIEENLFRGQSQDLGWGRLYGGQALGQALSAAAQTVPADRAVHSVHAYFLRHGDPKRPIVYSVDPIRDGRSFTTRRVVAIQGGKRIFSLSASFQVEEDGLNHQDAMPVATAPDDLRNEQELGKRYLGRLPPEILAQIPPGLRERAVNPRPIEIRPLEPLDPVAPGERPPHRQVWFRASGSLDGVDDAVHRYLLAYASDFHFLVTAMQPHGVSWLTPGMQVASLDHAMYFHRPFRMDDWLLYDIRSPTAGGSRGLVEGRFYARDGTLVASAVQQGLIRDRRG